MNKEILFISHSTHEDDYPASWLASKLQLLGYKVFIDLDDLRAGDTFNTVIQPMIQNESYKFITINTSNYIKKAAVVNSSVRKEINVASTVLNDNNFIIPVRFDNIDFTSFPMDYVTRKGIDFNNRWGEGLNELVEELEKLGTPKNNKDTNPLKLWHKAIKNENKIIVGQERILTNWFEIHLPEYIYIHRPFDLDTQKLRDIPCTVVLEANCIICFAGPEVIDPIFPLKETKKFKTSDFISESELDFDSDFKLIRPYDKLKQLLNRSFKNHCLKRGLKKYEQAAKKEIFYFRFTKDENKPISISLKKYKRSRIQLNGNKSGKNWHFAIYAKCDLKPVPHYRVFYSIIFTDDKYEAIKDTDEQHALRRGFSANLNNKKAFESLLAAMLHLSYRGEKYIKDFIEIQIDANNSLNVANFPLNLTTNISYIEPKTDI